ncbi:MAG: glycosyltransferase [Halothiobacillus sp.]
MRILHVISSTDIGGAEQHVLDLSRIQIATGLTVAVAMPRVGALSDALNAAGIECFIFGRGGRWNPFTLWRIRRIIQQNKPVLIHAHMPRSAAMVARTNGSVPWIATAHNIVKSLKPFHNAGHVLCVSQQVRQSLLDCGFPAERCSVVHNAITPIECDAANRARVRAQLALSDRIIVLCVARLVPAKGHAFAIEAFPQILGSTPQAQLVLVGAGALEVELKSLANKLGVASRVTFLGARQDVPDLLRAADVYLQPSIKEGFCLAFLEAMSVGLPCIGTRTGAIPEMVQSAQNGLLIEPANPSEIAIAVSALLHDPAKAKALGMAAKKTARSQFSIERQGRETLALYYHVLAFTHALSEK